MAAGTAARRRRSGNRYSDAFRAKVVAFYVDHGLSAAEREFRVSRRSVSTWAKAAGVATNLGTTPSIEKATAARKAKRLRMDCDLFDKLCAILAAIDPNAPRDCRDLTWTFGVLLDKYRLEQGESTNRTEHLTVDQIEAELQRILAEG